MHFSINEVEPTSMFASQVYFLKYIVSEICLLISWDLSVLFPIILIYKLFPVIQFVVTNCIK